MLRLLLARYRATFETQVASVLLEHGRVPTFCSVMMQDESRFNYALGYGLQE